MVASNHRQLLPLSGFTLIEVVVVMGILAILLSFGVPYTVTFYRTYALQSDRNTLVALLQQARGASLANNSNVAHGVAITTAAYVGFEGATYATRNQTKDIVYPKNGSVTVTGPAEIVFQVRTGNATNSTFTLTSGSRQASITTNTQGMIDW